MNRDKDGKLISINIKRLPYFQTNPPRIDYPGDRKDNDLPRLPSEIESIASKAYAKSPKS